MGLAKFVGLIVELKSYCYYHLMHLCAVLLWPEHNCINSKYFATTDCTVLYCTVQHTLRCLGGTHVLVCYKNHTNA